MGYEKIASLDTDTVYALGGTDEKTGKTFPKSIEGYYLGRRAVESDMGVSYIHVFQTAKGNVGVWGKAALNSQLAQVKPGTMVMATVLGKKKIGGGKTKYSFEVQQDKTNRISVDIEAGAGGTGSDEDDGGDDTGYSDDDTSGDEDNFGNTEAMTASQANKRHVENLLKGKSAKN